VIPGLCVLFALLVEAGGAAVCEWRAAHPRPAPVPTWRRCPLTEDEIARLCTALLMTGDPR
jgi:hypothetical protein